MSLFLILLQFLFICSIYFQFNTTLGITYLERGQSAQLIDLNLRDVDDAYLLYFNESLRSTAIYSDNYNCLLDIHEQDKGKSSKYLLINYDLHQELKETEIKVKTAKEPINGRTVISMLVGGLMMREPAKGL